ncbi:HET domain-containing protein [Xylaria telfairii]|nr:HET domain-containing protein [Xylaria telfairii]
MDDLESTTYGDLADGSIRLLRVSNDGDSYHAGALEITNLSNAPRHYALSLQGGEINVSQHLAAGVRRLKQLAAAGSWTDCDIPVKYVWIDKICINQENTKERESQVQLMGQVFSSSVRTLIWLGPESLEDIPFKLYSDLNHVASGLPSWNDEVWEHLRTLLALPWFTRTWVVQEVALSPQDPLILHGDHLYSWDRLGWAASWLRRRGYVRLAQIPEAVRNIDAMANIRRSETRWSLGVLLTDTSTKFHATDQRDKIYGLLGLAIESQNPSNIPPELRPDYSLDVVQIYQKVGLFLLRNSGSLSLLTRRSGGPGSSLRKQRKNSFDNLPSWVPDWSDFTSVPHETSLSWISYSNALNSAVLEFPKHYAASAGRPAELLESPNLSTLRLKGIRVDEVVVAEYVGDTQSPSRRCPQNFVLSMRRIWDAAVVTLVAEGGVVAFVAGFIQTTTAEQHRLSGCEWDRMLKDGCAFILEFLLDCGEPIGYMALAGNYCFNRSFVVTSGNLMGICPGDTEVGDQVVVLYGGGVPYIARRQVSSWLFIGESYVHGLMKGEVFRSCRRGEAIEEVLEFK